MAHDPLIQCAVCASDEANKSQKFSGRFVDTGDVDSSSTSSDDVSVPAVSFRLRHVSDSILATQRNGQTG